MADITTRIVYDTPDRPSAREGHSVAFDVSRNVLVIFGGYDGSLYLNDTWEFDGVSWRQVHSAIAPSIRAWHCFAYDTANQRIVLFGGFQGASVLAGTWQYSAGEWTELSPATEPASRQGSCLAYDSARQRVVLFGGVDGAGVLLSDTWEFDGTDWAEISPATSPSARKCTGVPYNPEETNIILFGGEATGPTYPTDTWEYDGTNWTQRSTSLSPAGRSKLGLFYDSVSGRSILFGGADGSGDKGDTWSLSVATGWVQHFPVSKPAASSGHHIAYDVAARRTRLFGGSRNATPHDELWSWNQVTEEWAEVLEGFGFDETLAEVDEGARLLATFDGIGQPVTHLPGVPMDFLTSVDARETGTGSAEDWHTRTTTTNPNAIQYAAAAYDSDRRVIVLFGGTDITAAPYFAETWEFDGNDWAEISPATSPPGRRAAAMAYDSTRQKIVLFGGQDASDELVDTWEYDGTTWTQITPAASPPERTQHVMTYDAARGVVVLFGGVDQVPSVTLLSDTWEYDGTTWTQIAPATSPPARRISQMEYDSARQKVVLFGGDNISAPALNDTWEYDGTDWTQITPATSPSVRMWHEMAYNARTAKMVVFGGVDGAVAGLTDTWQYDGTNWTELTTTGNPAGVMLAAMEYQDHTEGIAHFGGLTVAFGASTATNTLDSDRIKYHLVLDGQARHWDGTAWANSDGSFWQSNTVAEINANASTAVTSGVTAQVVAVIHAAGTGATPEVEQFELVHDFFAIDSLEPTVCKVYGWVLAPDGSHISGASVIVETPARYEHTGHEVIPQAIRLSTDSSGYWETDLVETATVSKTVNFTFAYIHQGQLVTHTVSGKTIPDEASKAFTDL